MKFIDKCIKEGITSKEIRENRELDDNYWAQLLADNMEEYEKTELRKKKLKQIEKNVRNNFTK